MLWGFGFRGCRPQLGYDVGLERTSLWGLASMQRPRFRGKGRCFRGADAGDHEILAD